MRKQNKSHQIWRVGGWVGFVIKSTTKGTCRLLNASCLGRSSLRRASYHAYLPRAPRLRAVGGHGLHRRRHARRCRDRAHLRGCRSSRCVRRPRNSFFPCHPQFPPDRSGGPPRGRNLHASHREGAPPGGCTVSFLEIHSGAGSVTGPVFVAARAPVTRFLAVARPSFPVVQTARTRRNCFPFFFLNRTRMKHFP